MATRPSVLCPIDFSNPSRGALRYAAALAEHFYATLQVLTVDDPFLANAAAVSFGAAALEQMTQRALQSFIDQSFTSRMPQVAEVMPRIRIGEAAPEILRTAAAVAADVIVMSTHGNTGVRKLLFGSTTERVLRETHVPVVVTPGNDPGPESVEAWTRSVRSILAPVDLSEFSSHQLRIAQGLAEAAGAAVVVAHVLEPLATRDYFHSMTAAVDEARRSSATTQLHELLLTVPTPVRRTIEIAAGDPASEIARLAGAHATSAIVMALHSSPAAGRRIGSVTYRLLCRAPAVVVALPPTLAVGRLPLAAATVASAGHR